MSEGNGNVMQVYTVEDVAKHNKADDIWIIVDDKVFDLTDFLDDHPGGKRVLVREAGKDASKKFHSLHSPQVLDHYSDELLIGTIGSAADQKKDVKKTNSRAEKLLEQFNAFGDVEVPYADPDWYRGMKSNYYKESHTRLRKWARGVVEEKVMPFVHDWDESKKIPAEVFKEFGQLGMVAVGMGPPWNSELFGMEPPCGIKESEWDAFHELVVVDELCRCGSGGVAWGMLGGSCIGVPPIMTFASDDLKRRVVPEVIQGDAVACLAITEPYAGSDVAQIRTSAKKSACGKFYVVNGEKKWITNGMFAKWFTVAVRTGGDGAMGISLLCISREMAGVKTKQMDCSGVWGSGTAYVTFEDVKVPVENLVGKENLGFKYIMYNFNHERWGLALQALRFSRVCLEESIVYANKRKTFGKPLIKNQAIRHKLAEMARQVESSWAWLEHLTFQLTQLDHKTAMLMLGGQMALLKVQSSKVFEFCAREAQQIFGGLGYTRSGPGEKVERLAREVRVYAVAGGSEEILRDLSCKIEEKKSKMIHKALNNRASM